jgi:hypothetical protein
LKRLYHHKDRDHNSIDYQHGLDLLNVHKYSAALLESIQTYWPFSRQRLR